MLEMACRASGKVIQAIAFHDSRNAFAGQPRSVPGNVLIDRTKFSIPNHLARCHDAVGVTAALPALQATAAGLGHINIYPEEDGAFRRIPHLIRYHDATYPSLAVAVALARRPSTPSAEVRRQWRSRGGDHLLTARTAYALNARTGTSGSSNVSCWPARTGVGSP